MNKQQRLQKLEQLKQLRSEWKLLGYKPYPKQLAFHNLKTRERALFGANRSGKTLCAGMEVAMHLTGIYPQWWEGTRFEKPVRLGIGSETGDLLKKGPQRMLMGPIESIGTGTIPKNAIGEYKMARGVPDGVDTLQVKRPNGGISSAIFMSYADGRAKWASDEWDGAWLDEEPEIDIYTEALTRSNTTMGPLWLTFTPLKGISDVVMRFIKHWPNTEMVSMTLDEALHFTPEARQSISDSYLEHEREARIKGVPILGSGRVFQHPEEYLKVKPFEIPKHWAIIGGMDFGIDHPFAAVKLAWDRDSDTVYVTQTYRERGLTPIAHSAALKSWGNIVWAWPHDGLQRDKQSGKQLAQFYRDQGLQLLSEHAQYPDERGNGLEASILDLNQRMETGRFKVFDYHENWFEEYRYYHRKEGQIVKERDDLLSASRYAVMMIRYAEVVENLPKSTRYRVRNYRNTSWMSA